MDDELIERVSREICKELDDDEDKFWRDQTGFAKRIVAIVRAAVIEECAKVADDEDQELAYSGQYDNWAARQHALELCAAAIRKLGGTP